MKKIVIFILFITLGSKTQSQLQAITKDSILLKAERFIGVDTFGGIFYTQNNILFKKWDDRQWQYGDLILGELTSVSILNPLKILLFYDASNTIVFVDKYLTEIERINFNIMRDFKTLSTASIANDNQIWLFDNNSQQLQLFDTDSKKTLVKTQPLLHLPIKVCSNFNYSWILTEDTISQFNSYGSLLNQFENQNFTDMGLYKDGIILQNEEGIYVWKPIDKELKKIILPQISIKQFYVAQEILYIYDLRTLYSFNLTKKKINQLCT